MSRKIKFSNMKIEIFLRFGEIFSTDLVYLTRSGNGTVISDT